MAWARHDGFSLIEVMVVGALVATVAGISVPTIAAGMRLYTLTSASQQIASTIRSARVQAVGKNQLLQVRFDYPADNQYQIVAPDDTPIGPVMVLPTGATFGAISGNIQFDQSGRVTALAGATPVTVVVSNGDESQNRTVTISASGRVQLP